MTDTTKINNIKQQTYRIYQPACCLPYEPTCLPTYMLAYMYPPNLSFASYVSDGRRERHAQDAVKPSPLSVHMPV